MNFATCKVTGYFLGNEIPPRGWHKLFEGGGISSIGYAIRCHRKFPTAKMQEEKLPFGEAERRLEPPRLVSSSWSRSSWVRQARPLSTPPRHAAVLSCAPLRVPKLASLKQSCAGENSKLEAGLSKAKLKAAFVKAVWLKLLRSSCASSVCKAVRSNSESSVVKGLLWTCVTHHRIHLLTWTEAPRGFGDFVSQIAKLKGPYCKSVFFLLSGRVLVQWFFLTLKVASKCESQAKSLQSRGETVQFLWLCKFRTQMILQAVEHSKETCVIPCLRLEWGGRLRGLWAIPQTNAPKDTQRSCQRFPWNLAVVIRHSKA